MLTKYTKIWALKLPDYESEEEKPMDEKPKALDVDKMEEMFDKLEALQDKYYYSELAKLKAYNEGYIKALLDCRSNLGIEENVQEFFIKMMERQGKI